MNRTHHFMFVLAALAACDRSFKIVGDEFQMDGQPFRYISGSFHYFRQHPDDWESTIAKMAAGGLNALQTYVAWNIHEPTQGAYNFQGFGDIERFLSLCQKYNLYVILRPGPFICAEWEFGGFPYWLLQHLTASQFRTSDPTYLHFVGTWFSTLFAKVKPFMYHNGGPVILVQIENEYGSYPACDAAYLRHLAETSRSILGAETTLFTTDGSGTGYLKCGSLRGEIFATVDFGCGANIAGNFKLERDWNGGSGPYVNSEFYAGWLDHWNEPHAKTDPDWVAGDLDKMLALNGSVNIYMYFGGTNFGFTSGANGGGSSYSPQPTSYDYDAPLSEAADMRYKWQAIQKVIKKYRPVPTHDVANSTKKAYGTVQFGHSARLFDALSVIANVNKQNETPLTFEALDQGFGFVLYRSQAKAGKLSIPTVHDRAYVFVDQKFVKTIQRGSEADVAIPAGVLDILVENQGRLNYGGSFVEFTGLVGGVKINGQNPASWNHFGFDLTKLGQVTWSQDLVRGTPALYRATFNVDRVGDTFLNPKGLKKGVAIVNGFNIGRYWTVGPQLTLFVPSHVLKVGVNELIIFEQEGVDAVPALTFDDTPQISII